MIHARPFDLLMLACCFLASCAPKQSADTIYFNGPILTMVDAQPQVEAVAVKEGKVCAIGSVSELIAWEGPQTEWRDLQGKTLLPGFIDAHSHLSIGMRMVRQANLTSPPVGDVVDIPSLVTSLQEHQQNYQIPTGQWITGWGYDPDQLTEDRHPNKLDLDAVFPDHPVFLLHVSAHMAVVNSKALELADIDASTPDPESGVIVRMPGTQEPSGLLQEKAMYLVLGKLPVPDAATSMKLLEETLAFYASRGITTAQDGLVDIAGYQFLSTANEQLDFPIDVEVLASYRDIEGYLPQFQDQFGQAHKRLRLAGIKVVGDGSPQGKTAFFSQAYRTEVPGCTGDCRGVPTVTQAQLEDLLNTGYAKGIQMYVHCNGDASIDMLLKGHEAVMQSLDKPPQDPRTVVIHSQFVRRDQLEAYKNFGFVPAYFTNHAFFWGDVHRLNLGEERASFLSPMRTSMEMGIICTNHTDYIVTPLNQLFLLWTAVNRKSRSGVDIGPEERLSPWEGLKAITINAAYQHKTEQLKGSIEIGKLADFVLLDKNPLTVDPMEIKDIQVLSTIKEGKVIYE